MEQAKRETKYNTETNSDVGDSEFPRKAPNPAKDREKGKQPETSPHPGSNKITPLRSKATSNRNRKKKLVLTDHYPINLPQYDRQIQPILESSMTNKISLIKRLIPKSNYELFNCSNFSIHY